MPDDRHELPPRTKLPEEAELPPYSGKKTKRPTRPKVRKTEPEPAPAAPVPAPAYSTRADDILEQFEHEESTRVTAKIEKDLREYQYFLQCHACAKPGIFFNVNPYGRLIVDTDWFSTYKEEDELYLEPPHCQSCERRGRHEALLLEAVTRKQMPPGQERLHGWRCRGRWAGHLMKIPRDPTQRAKTPRKRAAPETATEPHLKPITY